MSPVFIFHFSRVLFSWAGEQAVDARRRDDRTTHLMLDLISHILSCHVSFNISFLSSNVSHISSYTYSHLSVSLYMISNRFDCH